MKEEVNLDILFARRPEIAGYAWSRYLQSPANLANLFEKRIFGQREVKETFSNYILSLVADEEIGDQTEPLAGFLAGLAFAQFVADLSSDKPQTEEEIEKTFDDWINGGKKDPPFLRVVDRD